jgi:hypothetical protein
MDQAKIVVRFIDGRVLKGFTQNFLPNKPSFHLRPQESSPSKGMSEVHLDEIKAVFFVKDFTGNSSYQEKKSLPSGKKPLGRTVGVQFKDGEKLVGSTMGYDPKRLGFFLTPLDAEVNNLRVFVVSKAVEEVRFF